LDGVSITLIRYENEPPPRFGRLELTVERVGIVRRAPGGLALLRTRAGLCLFRLAAWLTGLPNLNLAQLPVMKVPQEKEASQ
jgi:hypothetical protein